MLSSFTYTRHKGTVAVSGDMKTKKERRTKTEEPPYIQHITKTSLFKYIMKILSPKNEKFQIKNSDIFHISAQNIDCGYSLEPPRRGGSNEHPQSMF